MSRSNNSASRCRVTQPRLRCALFVLGGAWFLGATGCGTDFNEILRQGASSGGRVLVDILLTDLANIVAEIGEQNDAPLPPDPNNDGTDDPDDLPPPPVDLEPDAFEGAAIFAESGCGGCHCPDAAGGCALSAPSLINAPLETLDASVVGDGPHVGGKFGLSQQDLADLEAYLVGLGG